MNVFIVNVSDGVQWASPVLRDSATWRTFDALGTNRPIASSWKGMALETVREDDELPIKTDAVRVGPDLYAFSDEVRAAIENAVARDGEFLEATVDGDRAWIFHVLTHVDAFDEENAVVERDDLGRLVSITKWAFREQPLRGKVMFKLIGKRGTMIPLFATDRFRQVWISSRFSGLRFRSA